MDRSLRDTLNEIRSLFRLNLSNRLILNRVVTHGKVVAQRPKCQTINSRYAQIRRTLVGSVLVRVRIPGQASKRNVEKI